MTLSFARASSPVLPIPAEVVALQGLEVLPSCVVSMPRANLFLNLNISIKDQNSWAVLWIKSSEARQMVTYWRRIEAESGS